MTERRLDYFARRLGAAVSRRCALRGAAGILVGAVLAWRNHQRGLAQGACTADDECLDEGLDPCLGAFCLDGACQTFVADCLPGDYCCGNGVCCTDTDLIECFSDGDCASDSDDPCMTAVCDAGLCATLIVDCAPGYTCCDNGECCVANDVPCEVGADCRPVPGAECGPRRCPPGFGCRNGVCMPQ